MGVMADYAGLPCPQQWLCKLDGEKSDSSSALRIIILRKERATLAKTDSHIKASMGHMHQTLHFNESPDL